MSKYVDGYGPDDPKARRLRHEAFKPEFAMGAFLDRALDQANPQAGLFAIAYSLSSLLTNLRDEIENERKSEQEQ